MPNEAAETGVHDSTTSGSSKVTSSLFDGMSARVIDLRSVPTFWGSTRRFTNLPGVIGFNLGVLAASIVYIGMRILRL